MPPKKAAAAPPTPLGEVDANRVTAPAAGTAKPPGLSSIAHASEDMRPFKSCREPQLTTVTTLKPAPKSRKRKSDAVEGDSAAASAPAPKKAATKKKEDPMPDLSGIHLPGDESMSVPVYDTCSTVRTKINALLKKDGVTKAGFLRACVKAAYGAESTHKTAPSLLANFLAKKGPTGGNTSSVFYAAYVFFEKLRIRDGKAKTKTREEMEATWGAEGFDREHDASRGVWCHASEAATVDKHGKLHIVPRGGGRPRGGWF